MPYVPKVLPAVIPDPIVRRRAEEAFLSEDFKENIESYFVDNIKVSSNRINSSNNFYGTKI
jgi:hypothetical protein